jgi:integrase
MHANRVHAAGWPEGIRPYNARHALMIDAENNYDVDLSDLQGLAGHTTPNTTRAFYAPITLGRQRQVADKLEGRLAELFTLKVVG